MPRGAGAGARRPSLGTALKNSFHVTCRQHITAARTRELFGCCAWSPGWPPPRALLVLSPARCTQGLLGKWSPLPSAHGTLRPRCHLPHLLSTCNRHACQLPVSLCIVNHCHKSNASIASTATDTTTRDNYCNRVRMLASHAMLTHKRNASVPHTHTVLLSRAHTQS